MRPIFATLLYPAYRPQRIFAGLILAGAIFLACDHATAGEAPVALGSAASFGVLAGDTVTSDDFTAITGNLGSGPGTAVSGFPPGTVSGTIYAGGPIAAQAEADLSTAYNDAKGRSTSPTTESGNIGGLILAPGIYMSTSSLAISSGDLVLDAQGDATAVWIFQIASTLTMTPNLKVILTNGATAANVFWQVGSSATLETATVCEGTIMAQISISLQSDATLDGRALAMTGAVTLDANTINNPYVRPPAPSFGPTQRTAAGLVTLIITNTPNATLTLQSSTNYSTWTTRATLTPGVTPDTFSDSTAPSEGMRIYRAFYP